MGGRTSRAPHRNERGLNKLCHHAGGNRVVVAHNDYRAFAGAVKKLGYVAPAF